jgi:hypothetical protein
MTFLRNDQRAWEERELAAEFDVVAVRAHELALMVRELPIQRLIEKTDQIETQI